MSLLERIKATIFGEAPPSGARVAEADVEDGPAGARPTEDAQNLDVSTPADDPALDDVAAAGVQPISKPVDIEEAQNPAGRPARRLH